jgi:hypothetical protein
LKPSDAHENAAAFLIGLVESSMSFGMKIWFAIRAVFLVSAISGLFGGVVAQAAWPERTITIIVPFPPGGPNDLLGRLLASELGQKLGQTVIVENKVGANGDIGIAAGAHAQPDGYTLTEVTGVILINPSVRKTAYDPEKDFTPIRLFGSRTKCNYHSTCYRHQQCDRPRSEGKSNEW